MKTRIALLITITSTTVIADWSKLTYSEDSYVYIDKSTLKKVGDIAEVNQMFNLVNPQKSPNNVIT